MQEADLRSETKYPKDFFPPEGIDLIEHHSVINWQNDGIWYIYAKPNIEHTLEEAKLQGQLAFELFKGEKANMLLDIRDAPPLSIDARNYYGSDEALKFVKCICLITNSAFSRMIGNFYFAFINKRVKTKLVKNVAEGVTWINQL